MVATFDFYSSLIKEYKYGEGLLLTLPLFIFFPTLGVIWTLFLLLSSTNNHRLFKIFLIYLLVWISLINVTKIPVSDQLNYLDYFKLNKSYNFIEVCKIANDGEVKEPMFHLLTSIIYYLTFGSGILYFFILSCTIYGLLYYTLCKFGKLIGSPLSYTLTSCLVITFFTQYFSYSLHIIRQVLATVIVVYAVIEKCKTFKNNYLLLVLAFFIHSSTIFISLLSLIPWLYYPLKKKYYIIIGTMLLLFIIFFGRIGAYFASHINISTLVYLFSRMNDNAADNTSGVSMGIIVMLLIPLSIISLKILFYDLRKGRYYNMTTRTSAFYPIIYINLILTCFILSFSSAPLIQYRFFAMAYIFLPFILPYALYKSNPVSMYYLFLISIFL